MSHSPTRARLVGWEKAAVDFGPLLVFMAGFFFGGRIIRFAGDALGEDWCLAPGAEMFLALALFMPVFAIAFAYSLWKERRAAPMMLLSAGIIGVLGGLTFLLHDKTFFYMKPTLVYLLFAALLIGGQLAGRNPLQSLFDGALHMDAGAWRTLTNRYGVFFVALAIANEIAWRWLTRDCPPALDVAGAFSLTQSCAIAPTSAPCAGEAAWVNLKVFGFTALNLIFTLAQAPFLSKHARTS